MFIVSTEKKNYNTPPNAVRLRVHASIQVNFHSRPVAIFLPVDLFLRSLRELFTLLIAQVKNFDVTDACT